VNNQVMTYCAALRDGQAQCLAKHPEAYVIGLGVPGPTGIFGSTAGLAKQFGANRVLDMPASEGGMTGVVLGTAICGMRPILVHMRVDFAVLAMESIVNQAAKWHFMYGGQMRAPITVRMIIGRGWGQGPQHSQSLQAWFAHVPGLKVVMPTTARDAKGMLISAVEDDAPIIIFEHRWLYNVTGEVADGYAPEPLSGARVLRQGKDITLAGFSYMVLECLRAAEILSGVGRHGRSFGEKDRPSHRRGYRTYNVRSGLRSHEHCCRTKLRRSKKSAATCRIAECADADDAGAGRSLLSNRA
jgi:acetoin:2,6-dichlorophenolindophenol oxidoreductase subunit beta